MKIHGYIRQQRATLGQEFNPIALPAFSNSGDERRIATVFSFLPVLVLLVLSALSPFASASELGMLLRASLDHPGVVAKQQQATAADIERQAVSARYFGQGAISTSYQRFDSERVVGVYVPVPGELPTLSDTTLRYGLNYSIPVDIFGAIRSAKKRANGNAELAALAARQEVLLNLHQTTTAYAQLYALERQRQALKRLEESLHTAHKRLSQAVIQGQAAGVELLAIESELAGVQARTAAVAGAIATAQADLVEASGMRANLSDPVLPLPDWTSADVQTLPVKLAQARQQATIAGADEFRRTLMPSVSIETSYNVFQGGGDTSQTWEVGARLTMPVGVSGWRRGYARHREILAAKNEYAAAQRESERQNTALYSAYRAAREDMTALASEIRFRTQVLAVQREKWRVGAQTLENLLRHERDLLDAEYRLAQASAQALGAWSGARALEGIAPENFIENLERHHE